MIFFIGIFTVQYDNLEGWNRNLRRGGPMAQSLMAGMRLKYFIKEKDPDHVISWRDFLKFFSIAVRRYPKKGFPNDKMI